MKKFLCLFLCFIVCLSFVSCKKSDEESLWNNALYTENTEFGEGAKTITVLVGAEEKEVEFTIHTDKDVLSDALIEHKLIEGEQGPYGLYVKTVNGMTADYDTDKMYWAFYKDGQYLNESAEMTEIKDGEKYEIKCQK